MKTRMKALVCELCGSNEFIKEDGYFVCQHCKTKYSTEEARKLMIEGKVDVSGSTVKIDSSEELENLYQLARRAKDNENSKEAEKYYDMILIKDPTSWEAQFYAEYFKAIQHSVSDIPFSAGKPKNCLESVFKLINENLSGQEKKSAIDEVIEKFISIESLMFEVSSKTQKREEELKLRNNVSIAEDYFRRAGAISEAMFSGGDIIEKVYSSDPDFCKLAVKPWKAMMELFYNSIMAPMPSLLRGHDEYLQKIRKYEPSYQPPKPPKQTASSGSSSGTSKSSGGCYIATAVYGSYDCQEVWTLRRFRDNILAKHFAGRIFIRSYYTISPFLVKCVGKTDGFNKFWRPILDRLVLNLQKHGVENTPYSDKKW